MIQSNVFHMVKKQGVHYLTIPAFEKTHLVHHCFSTRLGGVSQGIFKSMNLGFNRGDRSENVIQNFKVLCSAIDVDYQHLVFSDQIHEDKVRIVTHKDRGKGIVKSSDIKGIDALITNESKVPLVTFYADCVPLFFLDPVQKVVGLAHAGWRGTVKQIGKKTVDLMHRTFKSLPKDILAAIGPSIGSCCFEVDRPVVDAFRSSFDKIEQQRIILEQMNHKYTVDLWTANEIILQKAGLLKEHITKTDICTRCHSDILFSHRATAGQRGSLAAIIELK